MNNSQFLLWLSDRLVNVYGESESTDFVLKLRELASEQYITKIKEATTLAKEFAETPNLH